MRSIWAPTISQSDSLRIGYILAHVEILCYLLTYLLTYLHATVCLLPAGRPKRAHGENRGIPSWILVMPIGHSMQ